MENNIKKINLDLTTVDGNAFFIMAAFSKQAKREGWPKNEIQAVIDESTEGDYNHLLRTFMRHCK